MNKFFLFVLFLPTLFAKTITYEMVLESVQKHHPLILQSLLMVENQKANLMNSQGAFDAVYKSKITNRTNGYYEGDYQSHRIEKDFKQFNSKVFAGFRSGSENLPIYDSQNSTLSDGEWSAGITLSLLRYRDLDKKRFSLLENKNELSTANNELEQSRVELENIVFDTYWYWILSAFQVDVYKKMLVNNEKRNEAIKKRVGRGDLAKIYLSEIEQYLLKRKSDLLKAQEQFFEASQRLSLLYRNEMGKVIVPTIRNLPPIQLSKVELPSFSKLNTEKILSNSVVMKNFDIQLDILKNKEVLAQNALDPKLDVTFETSKDQGRGDESLRGSEQKIIFSIEIPLEQNLGRGEVQSTRSKKRIVEAKKRFFTEKLQAKINSIFVKLDTQKSILQNLSLELSLSEKLLAAEETKFQKGDSNLLLVNIREQQIINTQIRRIEVLSSFMTQIANYRGIGLGILSGY